jgi:hypothetical protein
LALDRLERDMLDVRGDMMVNVDADRQFWDNLINAYLIDLIKSTSRFMHPVEYTD